MNAAQSGARSLNLNHEIDYIIEELKNLYKSGAAKPTDWKLVTVFIGSNDICHSCTEMTSLPPAFNINVLAAVERVRTSMTNVLVQIGNIVYLLYIWITNIVCSGYDESTRYCSANLKFFKLL